MTDIAGAIAELKKHGIESFELMNILVIPVESPDDIYPTAENVRRIFKGIDYQKSWRIDPYYYARHESLTGQMFENSMTDST